MLPFTLEEALKGKLCQLRNGMFAQIYMDMRTNPYIDTENKEYVLVGIVFPNGPTPDKNTWKADGLTHFSPGPYDIVGILEPHELQVFENYKMLYHAWYHNNYCRVSTSGFKNPVKVIRKNKNGTFTLDFGEHTKDMNPSEFKDLKVIEKFL